MTITKLPHILLTKAICFHAANASKYMTPEEIAASFAYVLENCVVTGAQPAKPLHWTRLRTEN